MMSVSATALRTIACVCSGMAVQFALSMFTADLLYCAGELCHSPMQTYT